MGTSFGQAMARRRAPEPALDKTSLEDEPPSIIAEIHNSIAAEQDMGGVSYFRPSAIGSCKRAAWYDYLKYRREPQRIDSRLQLIFDNGTSAHDTIQKWLARTHDYYVAPEVHVWVPFLEVFGHADAVLIRRSDMYRFVGEFKSINSNGFNRLTKPKDDHKWQANLYCGLLKLEWYVVVYWNKDTQALREWKCRFDPDLFDDAILWCESVRDFVDNKELPPFIKSDCNEEMCRFVSRCRKARAAVEAKE